MLIRHGKCQTVYTDIICKDRVLLQKNTSISSHAKYPRFATKIAYVQPKKLSHFKIFYTDGICSICDIFHLCGRRPPRFPCRFIGLYEAADGFCRSIGLYYAADGSYRTIGLS